MLDAFMQDKMSTEDAAMVSLSDHCNLERTLTATATGIAICGLGQPARPWSLVLQGLRVEIWSCKRRLDTAC